ncbi:GPP34 family phosphoprotein [Micromonospora haikouensis]|uniref:GOLPH3/VPS74 family protein n=1 Tax=Micromonospora haikouensis TaxID=686309 RepID=UPI00368FB5FA
MVNAPSGPAGKHPESVRPARPARAFGSAAAQTSRIADEFFFMAHDDRTGRPRLYETALSHGLAAGLLAELYYARRITFDQGHIRVRDARQPTDWLQHLVLEQLVNAPQHTATRVWLAFFATSAYDQVSLRMRQAGLLRTEQTGMLWRQRTLHVPTDVNTAAWSWAHLSQQLRHRRPLDDVDVTLAGLALHTQLDRALLDGAPFAARVHLRQLVHRPSSPLGDLFAELDSAIGGAVLSHRTS